MGSAHAGWNSANGGMVEMAPACFDCALRAVVAVRSLRLVPFTEENP